MYDYSGSTGFVPVNSPKVRKSRSGSLAGGRGYGADLATRMMARAETEKGGRQIDEYFGQGRERRFEYPDTPAPPMINQRNGTVNFGGNIEGVDGRLSGSGERKHEYSSGNGTDSELEIIAVKKVKKTKTCQSKDTHIPQPARTNTTLKTPGSKLKTPEPTSRETPRPRQRTNAPRVRARRLSGGRYMCLGVRRWLIEDCA